MVLPAGTLLKCTLNEPNLSSATVAVGDPVLCHLHSVTEFGQQAFPARKLPRRTSGIGPGPGTFLGQGQYEADVDRIGHADGDMPLDAKVIATRGYRSIKMATSGGKGHAQARHRRMDAAALWPWKIIMLPARGPRPTLKGESQLTLRLMMMCRFRRSRRPTGRTGISLDVPSRQRRVLSRFVLRRHEHECGSSAGDARGKACSQRTADG